MSKIQEFEIGDLVIVRSNEWENIIVGPVTGYTDICNNNMVVFDDIISGKTGMITGGIMRSFSWDVFNTLAKLNPDEQWLVMSRYQKNLHHAVEKELTPIPEIVKKIQDWMEN